MCDGRRNGAIEERPYACRHGQRSDTQQRTRARGVEARASRPARRDAADGFAAEAHGFRGLTGLRPRVRRHGDAARERAPGGMRIAVPRPAAERHNPSVWFRTNDDHRGGAQPGSQMLRHARYRPLVVCTRLADLEQRLEIRHRVRRRPAVSLRDRQRSACFDASPDCRVALRPVGSGPQCLGAQSQEWRPRPRHGG
jgi:hypothetical protein